MAGTQQSVVRAVARQDKPLPEREDQAIAEQKMQGERLAVGRPRIAGPVDGTLIALDPDIPPANQRLQLRAANVPQGQEVYWLAGTQTIGQGSVSYWLPMPGRQVLTLTDKDGIVLDRVSIQVRGATLAVAP